MSTCVSLQSFDEVLAELEQRERSLPDALGSILAHCAQSIELACTGYPIAKSIVFRTTVGRIAKWKFLRDGFMRHDLSAAIPGASVLGPTTAAQGVTRLRQAIEDFRAFGGSLPPHFAYGALTRGEAERLQAMHVADHLSRVSP